MNKGTSRILIMIVVALLAMFIVNSQFPEFQAQLSAFFAYFAFIGLVMLLIGVKK